MPHPADRLAFDRAQVVEPVWNRMETAADAVGLSECMLLHAGPAFAGTAEIPLPILNSACVATVWEGLAGDFVKAKAMILAGELDLLPAQDHRVVVPLAAVVSASMPLHCVYDAHRGNARAFAPINGGNGPAMRLGVKSNEAVEHLRWLNDEFADALLRGIAEGIPLIPLAVGGLAEGDDCHGRTVMATQKLVAELRVRSGGHWSERVRNFLDNSPGLFLNLWMAATKCALAAAEGVGGSGLITAAGANGSMTGIQVSGLPGQWFTAKASPPRGPLPGATADRALAAIGDSAVVDAFGLGAMALHLSPAQATAFEGFLPEDAELRRECLPVGRHLGFGSLDVKLGVSARHAVERAIAPMIGLGVLDRLGRIGRIGGGIHLMPQGMLAEAVAALDESGRST